MLKGLISKCFVKHFEDEKCYISVKHYEEKVDEGTQGFTGS